MSYKVIISATDKFRSEAKKLSKKHASLKEDLIKLQSELLINPKMGVLIKENTYKIRLAIKSKNRGKSGGARVITYYFEEAEIQDTSELFLLTIYDKAERSSIDDSTLNFLIREVEAIISERNSSEEE
jgi:mRNA-degrading endonuclease RelE of RelBE toxin-antitoxin system